MNQTWIEQHPDATKLERVTAYARSLIGTSGMENSSLKEWFGFDAEWDISDEPFDVCTAFDYVVMRCVDCDWWCAAEDVDDGGQCDECRSVDYCNDGYRNHLDNGIELGEIDV